MKFSISSAPLAVALWASVVLWVPDLSTAAALPTFKRDCRRFLTVKFGRVDPRFKRAVQDLQVDLRKAIELWNDSSPNALLMPLHADSKIDPDITVNFVFDERQERTNEVRDVSLKVEEMNAFNQSDLALSDKSKAFENDGNAFTKRVEAHNARIQALEQRANEFKAKTSITESERSEMETDAQSLNQEGIVLDEEKKSLAERLRILREEYAIRAPQREKLAKAFPELQLKIAAQVAKPKGQMQMAETRSVYGPDGSRQPQTINVYAFSDQNNLRISLAHELGHALGLEHVAGESSVMYWLSRPAQSLKLSSDDRAALKQTCGWK